MKSKIWQWFNLLVMASLLLSATGVFAAPLAPQPLASPSVASARSLDAEAATSIEVHVPNFTFDPLRDGEPELRSNARFEGQGAGLRLVQFFGPTQDAWLEGLKRAGLQVLQYYPDYTYLVWGADSAQRAAATLDYVRWTGAFHPAYKLNADLMGREGRVQNVDVFFYNDGNIGGTLAALEALGAKVIQAYPAQPDRTFYVAVVELDAATFEAASRLAPVLWLGYAHPEPVLEDEMSSQIQAGNFSGAGVPFTGYMAHLGTLGVDGSGVRWATIDTGVDYDHPDLGPRIVAGYSFPGTCAGPAGTDCTGGGHGTHVAGIIGGDATAGFSDANGFLYGLGVAPAHDIIALNSLSGSAWPPAGGWQEHSKQAILLGAVGGNNSWTTGEGANHGYQASERTHDITVLDGNFDTAAIEPFIQIFSAGNSGPGANTLTAPKEAKNLIVVASSVNYRAGNINGISSFSSRGPAVDGRIVPTIAAPGEQIASARNDLGGSCSTPIAGTNNLYAFCSGTSMAAPHVAGAVVLATEWWRTFNAGANPSPAMAKALLVNSATPMGVIPNFNEGWGRVNITNMLQPDVPVLYWDQTHIFGNSGEQWMLSVGVADPTKPLKVTLAWSDAPGAVGANPALVNNLDLTVINGVSTYRGNVFSGGWSATGGVADNRNNLENVYIQNPAGDATIIIDATNIAGDAVLGNADPTDQNFALICQNCVLFSDFTLTVDPTSLDICAPADAVYSVAVGSILGFDDPVTLSVSGNPAGTTVGFSVNPVIPPGNSTLTIGNTGAATPGNYTLEVTGTAPTSTHESLVGLNIFAGPPVAPMLLTPANGAGNVPTQPTFTWNAAAGAGSYSIQVATDAGFTNVVAAATGLTDPTWTSNITLNSNMTYYWRVWADNVCAVGPYSATRVFVTVAAPGFCSVGTVANIIYEYGFESGAAGWTTPAGIGTNTWAISTANPFEGANHYRGAGTGSVTDQRLVSPPVALPTGENPLVLKFWHVPNLENNGATACYDGGILEVSTDGGTTWTQVLNSSLLIGGYTGAISGSFSNPLAGLQAWCGPSTTTYMQTIADLSAYAGQTVQFRMRIGTDSSVSRPGWDIDNVTVQSCQAEAQTPEITLTKTVGTDPSICAATSDIAVPAGTEVTYCYTVENTGDVTLDIHNLVDSELGALLSDFVYALEPGTSAFITETAVIHVTTVNTATWTAEAATGGLSATATASATVTVASIEIVKTVGLVDGVCAADSSIGVAAGTTVYYCYTITNTGDVTLNLHDLDDDVLGTILSGFNFALAPGASVNTVAAGLSIPYVANASVTNTATWTAYNANGPAVEATASATVTVASIEIAKTVGTVDGVCAGTDEIAVPEGTTVYYCYTITNTGDVTLNLHDLEDSELGNLFTAFPYALTPGSSVNTVDAGVTASAIINVTTVNTATWTAYNANGPSVTATTTARVAITPTAVTLLTLRAGASGVWSGMALLGALALGGFTWKRKRR